MLRLSTWTVLALALGAFAGCGGGGGEGADDATSSAAYQGPIASNDIAHGEEVYNNVCMACHASGPELANIGWEPAAIRQKVREGGTGMSALPPNRLTDGDLEAVIAFMTTNGGAVGDVQGAEPASAGGEEEPPAEEEAPAEEEPAS